MGLTERVTGGSNDAGRDIRVGIAFPFDDAEIETLAALSPRLRLRATRGTDQAAIDQIASEDLDGLIGQALPSDLARTPSLRWLQVMSAGIDALTGPDSPPWRDEIQLTNARGAYAVRIAQYTIAAILSVAERHRERLEQQAGGEWPDDPQHLVGRPLRGQTLVIVGYGGIGREIARLARAHGMRILAVKADPSRPGDEGFRLPGTGDPDGSLPERITGLDGLVEAAREADFLSITLPLTRRSRGVVSRDVLAALPAHAWIVNTGRALVLDQAALDAALAGGRLGGAVLDVFEEEPLPATSPLWQRPNVIISPHISGAGAHEELLALATENVRRFVAGEPLLNRVDIERGY